MNKDKLYDIAEVIVEHLGERGLLDELLGAMDVDELRANLEHIDQMHDLNLFNE